MKEPRSGKDLHQLEPHPEPGPRRSPIELDGLLRDADHQGGLFDAQAPKITQLDYTAVTVVDLAKLLKGRIERQDVNIFSAVLGRGR